MDWIIIVVIGLAVLGGLQQGFFRSVCALGGLLLGLALAAWNYDRVAAMVMPLVGIRAAANAIGFVVTALVVMALAALLGALLARTFKMIGLGCLDTLAGGAFGLLQGGLVVTLGVLVVAAFFPQANWFQEARLPKYFFGACQVTVHIGPDDLAAQVRDGLKRLEEQTPGWLHLDQGTPPVQ